MGKTNGENMLRRLKHGVNHLSSWGGVMMAVGAVQQAHAEYALNLQEPATQVAQMQFSLNNILLLVCLVIFVLVFGVMFYSLYAHRKSKGHQAAHFHENVWVEVVWTVIPLLILAGLAVPATQALLSSRDTRNPDLTVKVTGYQWKWQYNYLEQGVSFYSTLSTPRSQIENQETKGSNYLLEVDHPMVVPVGKKVRLLLTADDVIHAWYVPAFGVKQDAIPGFVRETWFKVDRPGIYRGQCAELCGKEHGFMPIVVEAKTEPEYQAWMQEQQKLAAASKDDPNKVWTLADLKARGEEVYKNNCAACHKADGKGAAPIPALDGSKVANGPIAEHVHVVLKGRNAMPPWAQLSDTEIAAVVTYERNAWGNHMGDMIQPAEVKAAR